MEAVLHSVHHFQSNIVEGDATVSSFYFSGRLGARMRAVPQNDQRVLPYFVDVNELHTHSWHVDDATTLVEFPDAQPAERVGMPLMILAVRDANSNALPQQPQQNVMQGWVMYIIGGADTAQAIERLRVNRNPAHQPAVEGITGRFVLGVSPANQALPQGSIAMRVAHLLVNVGGAQEAGMIEEMPLGVLLGAFLTGIVGQAGAPVGHAQAGGED